MSTMTAMTMRAPMAPPSCWLFSCLKRNEMETSNLIGKTANIWQIMHPPHCRSAPQQLWSPLFEYETMSMPDYDIESNICTDQWECFVSLDTEHPSIFASQCFPRPSMDSSNCYTWATSMTSLTSITPLMLIFNNFRRPAIDRSVAIPLVATDALRILKLVTVVGVARPADVIFTKSNLTSPSSAALSSIK